MLRHVLAFVLALGMFGFSGMSANAATKVAKANTTTARPTAALAARRRHRHHHHHATTVQPAAVQAGS